MSSDVNYIARRSVPCYFCSELVEPRYLPEHVKHCGAVLEECPKKCGAYLPRCNLKAHGIQCSVGRSKVLSQTDGIQVSGADNAWKEKVTSVLNLLRTSVTECKTEQKQLEERFALGLESLKAREEELETLRNELSRTNCGELEYRMSRLEQISAKIDEQTSLCFKQTHDQLESLEKKFDESSAKMKTDEWQRELDGFRTFLSNENVMISAIWHEQLKQIHDLKLELEMRCRDSKEIVVNHGVLAEKIDILVNETRKHSEAIKNQVADTKALKFQLKENMNYLEDMVKEIQSQSSPLDPESSQPIPTNGRLLWRIDRYKEKMTDAKENDAVLFSPIFHNKEYGYTLRVELLLNGKGQWKDRHIIGSLKVIEGKWDPLLDWPCILQASIVLRDQENPANNFKKTLKVKRKDAADDTNVEKESGTYMFIPHTKLTRHDGFTKNNLMFLDIQIKDVKLEGSVASLIS